MDKSQRGDDMKKQRNYLMVSIDNLKLKADSTLNVSSIFKNNFVCLKHRYIVLKISNFDLVNNGYAYELLTNEAFKFDDSLIKTILNPNPLKEISAESSSAIITIIPKLVSLKEVRSFYKEIILYDEAKDYRKSINEILLNNEFKLSLEKRVKKNKSTR